MRVEVISKVREGVWFLEINTSQCLDVWLGVCFLDATAVVSVVSAVVQHTTWLQCEGRNKPDQVIIQAYCVSLLCTSLFIVNSIPVLK